MSGLAHINNMDDFKWHEWDMYGGACAFDKEQHAEDGVILIRHMTMTPDCVQIPISQLVPFLHSLMAAAKEAGVI